MVAADERGGLLGLVVVAEPHERGRGRAADQGGGVVAQVPEQQGQRDAAPLARVGEGFEVAAGDLVGAGDDDRRGGRGALGDGDGEPLDGQGGEQLGAGAARSGSRARQVYQAGRGGCGGPVPVQRARSDTNASRRTRLGPIWAR